jgi:DNA-binding XRE family transcriptional regulator
MNNKEMANCLNYKARAYRLALGLTQEEVANRVGISGKSVCVYERGIADSMYATQIMAVLNEEYARMAEKHGPWYKSYIPLSTALNEIKVWIDFEGYVPESIVRAAKMAAKNYLVINK